jgi:hypothetical protein
LDSGYNGSKKASEHHAQYDPGRDVMWERGRALATVDASHPLNSNVVLPETRVTTDPLENAMANLYYESDFDDCPLPNGIPSLCWLE